MKLVIDIGNTFVKAARFEGVTLRDNVHCRLGEIAVLQDFLGTTKPTACAVSCVAAEMQAIETWLNQLCCPVLRINDTTKLPFRNNYRTPHTLGSDRLAAVTGAMTLLPGHDVLVADIGTCLTLDVLTADGTYLGGNISLGPSMRFAALHDGTARLPLVEQDGDCPLQGYDTETAIRSGVLRGIALEIQGYLALQRRERPQTLLLVTGGKSTSLLPLLNETSTPRHEPHLVERGLNALIDYNLHGLTTK